MNEKENMMKNADDTRNAYKSAVEELGTFIHGFCNALTIGFDWAYQGDSDD